MKKSLLLFFLAVFFSVPTLGWGARLPKEPQPDKHSLLLAWERVQSLDKHTKTFEKRGERRFFFETDLFPFKNEVQVLHLTVDDEYPDEIEGFIAVKLTGVDKTFRERYADNYRVWNRHNKLIWSSDVNKWLTHKEYDDLQSALKQKKKPTAGKKQQASLFSTLGRSASLVLFWLFVPVVCFFTYLGYRKQSALRAQLLEEQKRLNASIMQSLRQQQATNMLLRTLCGRLRKPGPAPKTAPKK